MRKLRKDQRTLMWVFIAIGIFLLFNGGSFLGSFVTYDIFDTVETDVPEFGPLTFGGGTMNWPGGILQIGPDGFEQWPGLTRGEVRMIVEGQDRESFIQLLRVECSEYDEFTWNPHHASWHGCTTNGGDIGIGSTRYTNLDAYAIGKNQYLLRFDLTCKPDDDCMTFAWGDTRSVVGSYQGYTTLTSTYFPGTSYEFKTVVIMDTPPTQVNGNNLLYTANDGVYGIVGLEEEIDELIVKLQNPEQTISDSRVELMNWYRMFKAPTKASTTQDIQRYWRAAHNIMYNSYSAIDSVPSLWKSYMAFSPGSGYAGVWIWDSFFVAWSYINNCNDVTCVDLSFDSLRILIDNKYPSGQWAREVLYDRKGEGWQAPGGWSFAVDQADQRFNTDRFSSEFYQELKLYHEWVRTTDRDGDNLFQWGGTNSGWDGSVRWDLGGNNMEAVDLNAFMILDAEALRNMATRLGNLEDAQMWEQRRLDYIAAFQTLCDTNFCYDQTESNVRSPVKSAAAFYGLLAGAVTQAQAENIVSEIYNPATFGAFGPNGEGILPTVSRDDPQFCPCPFECDIWSGAQWINVVGIASMGMERYGLNTDSDYLIDATLSTLRENSWGYESYCSADYPAENKLVGSNPSLSKFGGGTYVWTDAMVMMFYTDYIFDFDSVIEQPSQTPRNVLCLGDSITSPNNGYCYKLKEYAIVDNAWKFGYSGRATYHFRNICYPENGETESCLDKVDASIWAPDADTAVLMLGTNDMRYHHEHGAVEPYYSTPQEYYDNLKWIVNDLKSKGYTVLMSTIPPSRHYDWGTANDYLDMVGNQTLVIQRNNIIRKVSDELNVAYVDVFESVFGGVYQEEMFTDQLHPNEESRYLMAAEYAKALENPKSYNCLFKQSTCSFDVSTEPPVGECSPSIIPPSYERSTLEYFFGFDKSTCDSKKSLTSEEPGVVSNGALVLDGNTEIYYPNTRNVIPFANHAYSIMFDFKLDNFERYSTLVSHYDWSFRVSAQNNIQFFNGRYTNITGPWIYLETPSLETGRWYNIVATYNPDVYGCNTVSKLYLDGNLIEEANMGCLQVWSDYGTWVGSDGSSVDYAELRIGNDKHGVSIPMDGQIDNLAIYSEALTASEVTSVANIVCEPDWDCSIWSECVGSSQTRTCTDINSCLGAIVPLETLTCTVIECSIPSDCNPTKLGYSPDCIGDYTCSIGQCGWACDNSCIPSTEVCDGLDNDCDELVDEELQRTCSFNGNPGVELCSGGSWSSCEVTSVSTFSCSSNSCIEDVNGLFSSESDCDSACKCDQDIVCTDWSEWSEVSGCGERTRTCEDLNSCGLPIIEKTSDYLLCEGSICGNGVLEPGEACDTSIGSSTCDALGYTGGTLSCTPSCTLDPSKCTTSSGGSGSDKTSDITYYSCSLDGMCVESEDGAYITAECNEECYSEKEAQDNSLILIVIGLILLYLYTKKKTPKRRRKK